LTSDSNEALCFSELPTREVIEILEQIRAQVPGFIGASLVDLRSGSTLAVFSLRADFDLAVAAAYESEIIKQQNRALQSLGLKTTLEDILLTLNDQIHLLRMVDAGTAFIFLAAERGASNLAIARAVLNHHASPAR
jgi:predicted regulator of Ras-like GTPase activity (Roadblock/LC7/MglB family)